MSTNFVKTLSRLNDRRSADSRPATGMVGQKCLGYVTDEYGTLIRIAPSEKDPDAIGPGTYNPEKPSTFRKNIKISSNNDRSTWSRLGTKPGPASYHIQENSTKIPHRLDSRAKDREVEPFLSGNLAHTSWISKRTSPIPKRRFPQVKFRKGHQSPAFASKQSRELFKMPNDEQPEPQPVPYKEPEVSDVSYSIFKREIPRFAESSTPTPSPCHYSLPNDLFSGPAYSLEPIMADFLRHEHWRKKDDVVPGPGYYNTEEKKPKKPENPVFASKIPREVKREEWVPPPGSYEVDIETDDKIAMSIKKRITRKDTDWTRTTVTDAPDPGNYEVKNRGKVKGGVMNTSGNRNYWPKTEDHKLAFSTPHSSLIKRTYNSKYYHVNAYV